MKRKKTRITPIPAEKLRRCGCGVYRYKEEIELWGECEKCRAPRVTYKPICFEDLPEGWQKLKRNKSE